MKFSIVTPSFRAAAWLPLCIASVADQEGVEAEQIVQDSLSDDGTGEWLPGDRRVRAFVEKDRGMYDAVNRGLRRSTGDLLAYLNCDEQYLPGALGRVAAYFAAHPEIDVAFGDVVVSDVDGAYLCHRKMVRPLAAHTRLCHLGTLTCATFFRRSVIERGFYFDDSWRGAGDAEWMLRLLEARIPMGVIGAFTSLFTETGANLGLAPHIVREGEQLAAPVPAWGRKLLPPLLAAHHRLRKWTGGLYRQEPFDYRIYTRSSPAERRVFHAARPTARWTGRV